MRMLNAPWTAESMMLWKELRQKVLCTPRATEEQRQQDPAIRTYYLPLPSTESRYFYAQKGDFSEVLLAPDNDKNAFSATLPQGMFVSEVSAEEARLPVLLRYPGLRAYFAAKGWATDFGDAPYVLSPVLFQNIYKGALGEVVGSYILKEELGIFLQEIEDPSCFEFSDFVGPNGLWFDFKHWKSNTRQREENVRGKTLAKLNAVGGPPCLSCEPDCRAGFCAQLHSRWKVGRNPRIAVSGRHGKPAGDSISGEVPIMIPTNQFSCSLTIRLLHRNS